MQLDEWKRRVKEIEEQANLEKRKVCQQYALSNSDVRKGDVIESVTGIKIRVDKIMVTAYVSYAPPHCVYKGLLLKKDGTPRKDGKVEAIHQRDVVKR